MRFFKKEEAGVGCMLEDNSSSHVSDSEYADETKEEKLKKAKKARLAFRNRKKKQSEQNIGALFDNDFAKPTLCCFALSVTQHVKCNMGALHVVGGMLLMATVRTRNMDVTAHCHQCGVKLGVVSIVSS